MINHFIAAVTIAEMARMAELSRSRFYQLMGTAFPEPSRDEAGRPYFSEDQQRMVLEVRRRNCGIDGKPVLFYAARHSVPKPTPRRPLKPKATNGQHADILDGVRALGLTTATAAQVAQAITESFPDGPAGVDPGEVIRTAFLSIRRQNSADNVER
jgi:hypothetical protein